MNRLHVRNFGLSFSCIAVVLLLTGGTMYAQRSDLSFLLSKKDTVRILVTDSGLGGYSVAAGIDSVLSANKSIKAVQVIFCNALPRANFRYNELADAKAKADVFSSVLQKMQDLFHPDVVLIACNTLSVVYPLTDFAKTTKTPVIGIVELGVKAITDSLKSNPGSSVLILGTETTIQSTAHRDLLLRNNIVSDRIITKACPNLESEIQADPSGDMVSSLVEFYLDEVPKPADTTSVNKTFAAFCCTHYGFAKPAFEKKLTSMYQQFQIINPNDEMIRLFVFPGTNVISESNVTISIFSQAELSAEEKEGIGKLISPVSPRAGKALDSYMLLNGIF